MIKTYLTKACPNPGLLVRHPSVMRSSVMRHVRCVLLTFTSPRAPRGTARGVLTDAGLPAVLERAVVVVQSEPWKPSVQSKGRARSEWWDATGPELRAGLDLSCSSFKRRVPDVLGALSTDP